MAKKELTLQEFLIRKIRSASQKWPETYKIKDRVRVEVRVEYSKEHPDIITIHVPETVCTLANGTKYTVPQQVLVRKVLKKAQNRGRVMYLCECCKRLFFEREWVIKKKDGKLVEKTVIASDHIEPVIELTGFRDWNTLFARMFPGDSGLQILCNYSGEFEGIVSCHHTKTVAENAERRRLERLAKGLPEPKSKKGKSK